jgi:1-acyl-sn-glycerol-3-phosphate acyltransferase
MKADGFARDVTVEEPGRMGPAAARLVERFVAPVVRLLFRPTLDGQENLPDDGAYVLVANHSAGVGLAEILCLVVCWLKQLGVERRLAAFALPLGFVVWPLSALHRCIGTVPSTYAAGRAALSAGVPILVFPGGDHESLKPVWRNAQVDFCGRVGFLRLAREMNVPIVPLGIRNGALTAPILLRARWLAWALILPRLLGVKRWGISLLGLAGAIALWTLLAWAPAWKLATVWLWLGSPLIFLPIVPATLCLRIGTAIAPDTLFPTSKGDDELRAALPQVEAAVEELMRA